MKIHRPLSNIEFNPNIDLVRALAILPVIAYHVYRALGSPQGTFLNWITFGYRGVYLFFALSGYILYDRFRDKDISSDLIKSYFWRRLFRLEPPYVVNLLLLFSFSLLGIIPEWRGEIGHLIASIFYSHNLVYGEPSILNGVLWSLEVEIQFYVLCPFLAMFLNYFGRNTQVFVVIILVFLGIWVSIIMDPEETNIKSPLGYLHYFLVGILMAITTRKSNLKFNKIYIVTIAATCLYFSVPFDLFLMKFIELGLIYVILYTFLRSDKLRLGRTNIIVLIGSMVYTIYMYHYLIIIALIKIFGINNYSLFGTLFLVVFSIILGRKGAVSHDT